jgi:alanine dehydrogenase
MLIGRPLLKKMKTGSVIVDVCIDQGGCVETCRPTTHHEPTYVVDGVVHYCVTNIPGAVSRTSSQALCNATLPYVRELASLGVEAFAAMDAGRAASLNLRNHRLVNEAVCAVYPDLQKG